MEKHDFTPIVACRDTLRGLREACAISDCPISTDAEIAHALDRLAVLQISLIGLRQTRVGREVNQPLPGTLKVVQVLQKVGDSVTWSSCSRTCTCNLEGCVSNVDDDRLKNRDPLPRCAGADAKSQSKIQKLNTLFLAGRALAGGDEGKEGGRGRRKEE